MKTVGKIGLAALLVCVAAYVQPRSPVQPMAWKTAGGSRAEGMIKLAYDAEARQINTPSDSCQGLALARKRCVSWGYQGAEAFDYVAKTCLAYLGRNCVHYRVEQEYQCTRPTDGNVSSPNPININIHNNGNTPVQNSDGDRTLKPL
ncbi:MAG: YecR family lipoprotein [Alysiella sp.]|uniref:YecR family lipoprotein n=1 Tax=Alysiella sp. TaxID=1872483 RepID=UPI0026DAF62C|nr:YecR family lipoprotein [Alysiella sp.]MDO4433656.1 YecR family lipoprotein [Alysiella sp.]